MLTKAKCPACGGALELNPGLERGICVYCGSEFLVQEAIQKFKAEIDGLPTLKNMLIRAEQKLSDGDLKGAEALYEEILKGAPTCHEAWWGKFKVNTTTKWVKIISRIKERLEQYEYDVKLINNVRAVINNIRAVIDDGRAMIKNLGSSREALRAIEYAPDDVKVFYRGEIERIKRKWEAELAPWEAKINELEEQHKKNCAQEKGCFLLSAIITVGIVVVFSEPSDDVIVAQILEKSVCAVFLFPVVCGAVFLLDFLFRCFKE